MDRPAAPVPPADDASPWPLSSGVASARSPRANDQRAWALELASDVGRAIDEVLDLGDGRGDLDHLDAALADVAISLTALAAATGRDLRTVIGGRVAATGPDHHDRGPDDAGPGAPTTEQKQLVELDQTVAPPESPRRPVSHEPVIGPVPGVADPADPPAPLGVGLRRAEWDGLIAAMAEIAPPRPRRAPPSADGRARSER